MLIKDLEKCEICPHKCKVNRMKKQFGRCKSKDTIKICDEEGKVIETTNRNNTWIVQTPQCFNRGVLLYCHNKHLNDEDITDDCMLLEREGFTIKMVEGDYSNIKLTTTEDLDILKSINNIKVKKLNK